MTREAEIAAFFDDRLVLLLLVLDQSGETPGELATAMGAGTADRLQLGERDQHPRRP